MIAVGDRVRVNIPEARRAGWNAGAADVLQGAEGVVEAVKPIDSIGCGGVLVRFDPPLPPTWDWGSPTSGHHFDPRELEPAS